MHLCLGRVRWDGNWCVGKPVKISKMMFFLNIEVQCIHLKFILIHIKFMIPLFFTSFSSSFPLLSSLLVFLPICVDTAAVIPVSPA